MPDHPPRHFWLIAVALGVATFLNVGVATAQKQQDVDRALHDYVHAPDAAFAKVIRQQQDIAGGTLVELIVTSQRWHGVHWRHQVFLFKPAVVRHPEHAVLIVGGGRWRPELAQPAQGEAKLPREVAAVAFAAAQLGVPVAAVLQVPHQPILGGKVEDAAIAHTFEQYLRTRDPSWPLLLPMVKSVVRAMDAVQAVGREQWGLDIRKFTLTGASKRGWTTWLTAAVDDRVEALVPMVFDVLNIEPQIEHQREVWGRQSERMHDYADQGLFDRLATPPGRMLQRIVDPFHYREKITQPKLLVLATNDRYWPVSALNFYWDQLEGDRHIIYVPNQGHGIRDLPRVLGGLFAVVEQACGGVPMPRQSWLFHETDAGVMLTLTGDPKPAHAVAWIATAPTPDLREAQWIAVPMQPHADGFRYELSVPRGQVAAIIGEATYLGRTLPLQLSTTVRVIDRRQSR